MSKKLLAIFLLVCSILYLLSFAYAQESLTITTYYPSPYGSYQSLQTRRLTIGNDDESTEDGVVNFQELGGNPSWNEEGALYYNGSAHEFRYYDGSVWKSLAPPACIRYNFTSTSGNLTCPAGYAIPMAPLRPSATSGNFLCCSFI